MFLSLAGGTGNWQPGINNQMAAQLFMNKSLTD
jgi:hypothetical protein